MGVKRSFLAGGEEEEAEEGEGEERNRGRERKSDFREGESSCGDGGMGGRENSTSSWERSKTVQCGAVRCVIWMDGWMDGCVAGGRGRGRVSLGAGGGGLSGAAVVAGCEFATYTPPTSTCAGGLAGVTTGGISILNQPHRFWGWKIYNADDR